MRILLIDDHALFRAGLALLLKEAAPHAEILHAGSCREGLEIACRESFNLVFLDVNLPDGNGLEALASLKAVRPSLPVVVVSADTDVKTCERAIALNAMGYVLKSAASEDMLAAVAPALLGGVSLPPEMLARQLRQAVPPALQAMPPSAQDPGSGWRTVLGHAEIGLSPRQFEVLRLLVQGHPNKIIARRLDISVQGVKKHVSDLLAHFEVMSRSQLIVLMAQQRIAFGSLDRSDPSERLIPSEH